MTFDFSTASLVSVAFVVGTMLGFIMYDSEQTCYTFNNSLNWSYKSRGFGGGWFDNRLEKRVFSVEELDDYCALRTEELSRDGGI